MKFVGIDLHTNRFTCRYLDETGKKRMKQYELTENDMALFFASVSRESTTVIIEATVNSFAFEKLIREHVRKVFVANTFQLKQISFTNKKTDKVDAYKLSRIHSLLKQNLKPFTKEYIFGKKTRKEIKCLCTEIPALNFQLSFLFDHLEHLEDQVSVMKNRIKEEGRSYMNEIDILTSMKGISVFTAIAIIADIISVDQFPNSKRFASYLRSTPKIESSNEKTIIKSTNKAGRKVAITLLSQALNHYREASPNAKKWRSPS